MAITALALGMAMSSLSHANLPSPAVVWWSAPVMPGEIVLLHGGDWGGDPRVEIASIRNAEPGEAATGRTPAIGDVRVLAPIHHTETGFSFVLPETPEGLYIGRVISGVRGPSAPFVLNEPAPWWVQGDRGRAASPGGWLRLFGRCLSFHAKAQMALKQGDNYIELPLQQQDQWSVTAPLPEGLTPGIYEVFVHNGYGGPAGWRRAGTVDIAVHEEVWEDRIFNVVDFGAVPNDRAGDTQALRAALAAAGQSGGGIVHLPRGRYQIQGTLEIPPFTLLQGESLELSQLYWPDVQKPPAALIKGSHDFGVEDLFITSGNYLNGIVSGRLADPASGRVVIRRVRMRLLRDQYVSAEERLRRHSLPGHALDLEGEFVRVTDCDIVTSGRGGSFALRVRYGQITGNRFINGGNSISGSENLIFENNTATGGGVSATPAPLYQRNIYFANNRLERNFAHDREAMTLDGGAHTYRGTVTNVAGTLLVLADESMAWRNGADHWINGGIMVLAGRGAGQLRRIRHIDGRTVEVDRPWTIEPDDSSLIAISYFRERHLFVGNRSEDATIALQLYGSLIEGIVAGNTSARAGGFHNFGMWKGGGPEPSWYIQYFDDEILEGNAYRGPMNEIPSLDSHLAIRDRGHSETDYSFTRTCLARRCILRNNARIEVLGNGIADNILIENCLVKNADVGLYVDPRAEGVILRGNRFDNVLEPMTGAIKHAVTHPADLVLAALSGAQTQLGAEAPAAWIRIQRDLETLAFATTAVRARAFLAEAVAALASNGSEEYTADLMRTLLGIDVAVDTDVLATAATTGQATAVPAQVSIPSWSLPVSVALRVNPFPGWTVASGPAQAIEPGGTARFALQTAVPQKVAGPFDLPFTGDVRGNGWRLSFTDHAGPGRLTVTDWLVVGPFQNESGEVIDKIVHPPELKLDVTARYETRDGVKGWKPIRTTADGRLDLAAHFADADRAVAYAAACVRAARDIPAMVTYTGMTPTDGVLLYVNGEQIGTPWRFNQWGSTLLRRGDNTVFAVLSNLDRDWLAGMQVEPMALLAPGELIAVPADELFDVAALKSAAAAAPEGRDLPHARGLDWRLVYEDRFDRDRLGQIWQGRSDAWFRNAEWKIVDGHVEPQDPWVTLAFMQQIEPPVRIEYDVRVTSGGGRMLGTMLCPQGMSQHRFWGRMNGYGYFLSVGWHDRSSNSVMRNDREIFVDEDGLRLEQDRWYHVTAQFVPPVCELFVDGEQVLEYEDENWIDGLDEVALYSWPIHWFDNVRIYMAK